MADSRKRLLGRLGAEAGIVALQVGAPGPERACGRRRADVLADGVLADAPPPEREMCPVHFRCEVCYGLVYCPKCHNVEYHR